jgi:hypothetical protein
LISRFRLEERLAGADAEPAAAPAEPKPTGHGSTWEDSAAKREASLRERKAQMVLAARQCVILLHVRMPQTEHGRADGCLRSSRRQGRRPLRREWSSRMVFRACIYVHGATELRITRAYDTKAMAQRYDGVTF